MPVKAPTDQPSSLFEEQVQSAYVWILGRNADATGLSHYARCLEDGSLSHAELRHQLLTSAEHRSEMTSPMVVQMANGVSVVVDALEPEFGVVIAREKVWEPHIVDIIRSSLRPGDTFVDIGGNVGVMSLNAAAVVGPRGKVIAFEPDPTNAAYFLRGVVANGFNNVFLYPLAVSDTQQVLSTSQASNAKIVKTSGPLQTENVVQAVVPDRLLALEQRVNFLKIDIEGYELPALRGCMRTLRKHRPTVLCEFNPLCLKSQGGVDPSELLELIFSTARSVVAVEHLGERTTLGSASEVMALWSERDREATEKGALPPGWLHFDLLFRPR